LIDAEHHREAFQAALQDALTTLTPREKTLLRLHFLDGMNIDALGVVFRVHRATVARWLVAIRTQVLDRVRQTLSLDLGASPSEAISLVRLLRSEVQLSIRRILEDGESVRLTDSVIVTKPPAR
jgi:RNA polymerase sigma-70 factor (ECF subfamily)